MNNSTRRGFLAMVGVGAAAAGATALAPSATAATPVSATPVTTAAPATDLLPVDASGSLVAYVHDVRSGELTVMVDGREVVVTNKALVAKLAKAVSAAARS